MKPAQTASKILAIALSAALCGCSTTGPIHQGFYTPPAPIPEKVPARVAVVVEGAPTESTRTGPSRAGIVDLSEYPKAVKQMLATVYDQVSLSSTAAQARDADYLVSLKPQGADPIALTFSDPKEGKTLATFSNPLWSAGPLGGGDYFMGAYFGILTAGIILIFLQSMSSTLYQEQETYVSETIAKALASIHDEILQNDDLMHSPAQKKELADTEARADQEAGSGDGVKALADYQKILAEVLPGAETSLRVQGKAADASARLGASPPVPEDAKDLMARGKAAFKIAASPADFAPAARDMEKALVLAPWWPTGHFNTALCEESAGQWKNAARHLKIYLLLSPAAPEKEQVRQKIAELELKAERGSSPAATAEARP